MLTPQQFYQRLLGPLTKSAETLYTKYPDLLGFSNSERDFSLFVPTFILGLYLTRDWDTCSWRNCYFLIEPSLSSWAVDKMNTTLMVISSKRKAIYSKQERMQGNQRILEALNHLHTGTPTPFEPPNWVPFGFNKENGASEWLTKRLV